MPVTKSRTSGDVGPCCTSWCCGFGGDFARKILYTLFAIFLVYTIIFVGTLIRNNVQKFHFIGRADQMEHTVVVEGEGKVTAVPDVGVVTMGVITKGPTVADAQQKSTDTMQALSSKLGSLGVMEKDIQTSNYNIYPKIKYTSDKGEEQDGFEVSQSVTVKIRDLTKANQVLALAGEVGANNVTGLQFVMDDPEVYRAEAREKALEVVAQKAKSLSRSLGVQIVGIVSYSEYPVSGGLDPVYGRGGVMYDAAVSPGSNEIIVKASVTFEIE